MRFTGIDQVFSRVTRLSQRLEDSQTPLTASSKLLHESIDRNFKASGRPRRWQALAPSTLAGRRRRGNPSSKPLIDTGAMMAGIQELSRGDTVEIGTSAVQANRLNYGYPGGSGRGHSRTPARPFVLYQPDDKDNVADIFSRHYRS